MPIATKIFTAEIDTALCDDFVPAAEQMGQSQGFLLDQALAFYLHNVVPSRHLVRREVMDTFEESVEANRDLLKRLAK